MASIWRPASWKGSFEANRDFGPSLSSAENPSSPLIPLVFFLDFPIGFEAAQRSLSNPAKAQRKLFSWCLYLPESTFVFTISYGYFNEKCQNHSEKWHFLTSLGYYLSFHFFSIWLWSCTTVSIKSCSTNKKGTIHKLAVHVLLVGALINEIPMGPLW